LEHVFFIHQDQVWLCVLLQKTNETKPSSHCEQSDQDQQMHDEQDWRIKLKLAHRNKRYQCLLIGTMTGW